MAEMLLYQSDMMQIGIALMMKYEPISSFKGTFISVI